MVKRVIALVAGLAVCAALAGCANGEKMDGAMRMLDRRSFTGTLRAQGQQEGFDTLIFEDGMFRSTACDQHGFGEAPYKVQAAGGNAAFQATTKNDQGDRMVWSGLVTGSRMDATATLHPAEGQQVEYVFQGMEAP